MLDRAEHHVALLLRPSTSAMFVLSISRSPAWRTSFAGSEAKRDAVADEIDHPGAELAGDLGLLERLADQRRVERDQHLGQELPPSPAIAISEKISRSGSRWRPMSSM